MLMKLPRGYGVVAAGLLVLGSVSPARAQIKPVTANTQGPEIANRADTTPYSPGAGTSLGQAPNTAVLGKAVPPLPPSDLGYNPSLSTVNAGIRPAVTGFSAGAPGFWFGPPWYVSTPTEGYLRGAADLTAATGQYWKDIQTARILREQSRQASIETERMRMQLELDYERNRPTAPRMIAAQRAADLEWARRTPFDTEIWSGRTLNVLLRSILTSPDPTGGPTIPLDGGVLRAINLTTRTSRGSIGLLKDGGKLSWPLPLQESIYDEPRNRLSQNMKKAADGLNSSTGVPRDLLKQLNADLATLFSLLEGQVQNLSPSDFIVSRRFLNRVRDTTRALSDPTLVQATREGLPESVRTVADLVGHMMRNGLEFAPAVAPGDAPAYTALFYALRSYEAAVVLASGSRSTSP
jgi:hypothetical protein